MKHAGPGLAFVRACASLVLLASHVAFAELPTPPSPVDILNRRDLAAPYLDAVPLCVQMCIRDRSWPSARANTSSC